LSNYADILDKKKRFHGTSQSFEETYKLYEETHKNARIKGDEIRITMEINPIEHGLFFILFCTQRYIYHELDSTLRIYGLTGLNRSQFYVTLNLIIANG